MRMNTHSDHPQGSALVTGPGPTVARGDGADDPTGTVRGPQARDAPSAHAPSPSAADRPALIVPCSGSCTWRHSPGTPH
jgi:hypothetical protein